MLHSFDGRPEGIGLSLCELFNALRCALTPSYPTGILYRAEVQMEVPLVG